MQENGLCQTRCSCTCAYLHCWRGREEGNPPCLLIHVPAVLEPGRPLALARASQPDRAATSKAPPLCRVAQKGLRTPGTTTPTLHPRSREGDDLQIRFSRVPPALLLHPAPFIAARQPPWTAGKAGTAGTEHNLTISAGDAMLSCVCMCPEYRVSRTSSCAVRHQSGETRQDDT